MNEFKIIATIGAKLTSVEYIDKIVKKGINNFRFNFSKFDEDFEERLLVISTINKMYGDDISILIDIPYPQRKVRIYHDNEYFKIEKDQLLTVSSYKESKSFFVDKKNIGNLIKENDEIIYSDGDATLIVEKIINNETIVLRPLNSFSFRNGKSISIIYPEKSKKSIVLYNDIIKKTNTNQIALSFVENKKQVLDFTRQLNYLSNLELFSKIETQQGINNVDSICNVSNIIIGRGDLCIYSDLNNLYYNQKIITDIAKKNNCKCYFATGILSSLMSHNRPTQSDIIDLSYILSLKPQGIILNSSVINKNIDCVIQTIDRINYYIGSNKEYRFD